MSDYNSLNQQEKELIIKQAHYDAMVDEGLEEKPENFFDKTASGKGYHPSIVEAYNKERAAGRQEIQRLKTAHVKAKAFSDSIFLDAYHELLPETIKAFEAKYSGK